MGIENLMKVINEYAGTSAVKKYNISRFDNMTIAVDASGMIYQTVIAIRSSGNDMTNKKGELTSHLHGIFYKLLNFLEHKIIPIFVFDGKPPENKNRVIQNRNARRKQAIDNITELGDDVTTDNELYIKNFKKTFKPSKKDIIECQIMLDLLGIPYICAPGEADVICAWLATKCDINGKRYVKGICSDDSDMLALGAPYLFKDMGKFIRNGSQITVVSLHKTLAKMDITMDQFLNLCVLLGCDNCKNIPGVGYKTVYKNINDHTSLEKIITLYKKKKPELVDNNFDFDCIIGAKNYFKNAVNDIDKSDFVIHDHNLMLRSVQSEEFMDFMCVKHNFDVMKIESSVNKINMCYSRMNITRKNTRIYHKILQRRSVDYEFLSSDSD